MNSFDYFFEHTGNVDKNFLVGSEEISFRELHRSSLILSDWIRKEVGTGNNILIISINNLFFLKVYLAIIKSENVCIPLDPYIEKDNLSYISALTKPSVTFITDDLQRKLPVEGLRCINPDNVMVITNKNKTGYVRHSSNGEDKNIEDKCAEIIFTSGSTGKPKGVMISHRNIIANTNSILKYLVLSSDDRMLVVLPFYYCYGLSLLHTHLRIGGSIVFNNSFIFLGTVINNLIKYNCTGFAGVPSHYQILLRKSDTFKITRFPSLRYVTQAGGKLATVFIDEFREAFPEISFYVMYGQTEATARLSYLPPELYEKKKGSMGKGIPGVELRVVNSDGVQVRPGETGEIIAKGDNIMMGYYLDDESTHKSLRDGWLWTGDLGQVDEEGYIYLTARKNEIIKVRGKRISPKEVEAVILQIPEIVDCSIEGVEDNIEGEILKATVAIREDAVGKITGEYLKRHCMKHLTAFKIPSQFEIKKSITISSTGKKIKKIEVNSK
jgi:acyl-CoA synthetase (AMP-forming)/AMP-acid ligase II